MGLFDIFKKKDKKTIVQDKVFGELEYENDYGYYGKVKLNFFGEEQNAKIFIESFNSSEIDETQYETYKIFMKKIKQIEDDIISNLLKYYNGGEKFAYGPDDVEENKKWWPEINTKDDMIKNIHFDEIRIHDEVILKNERCIYVLFNRDWGGPDTDDNGVAVEIKNEKVSGVGYKDIAY